MTNPLSYKIKTQISKLVPTTRVWNNLLQLRSKPNYLKAKSFENRWEQSYIFNMTLLANDIHQTFGCDNISPCMVIYQYLCCHHHFCLFLFQRLTATNGYKNITRSGYFWSISSRANINAGNDIQQFISLNAIRTFTQVYYNDY